MHNSRDLGGLPAGDAHILPRRLLRSGMLGPATTEDARVLRDVYDVRLVIDLRTDEEAERWPDPMELLPEARLVRLPVFRAPGGRDAQEAIDKAYGSLDAYLADTLGVDEAARSELRRKFVSA